MKRTYGEEIPKIDRHPIFRAFEENVKRMNELALKNEEIKRANCIFRNYDWRTGNKA